MVVSGIDERRTRFWDNGDFGMAQKPLGYGVECARLEYEVGLTRIVDIEVVRLNRRFR